MDSTGCFLAAKTTGIIVPTMVMRTAPAIISKTFKRPKSNKATFIKPVWKTTLSLQIVMIDATIDKTKQITVIKPDSEKKILKRSLPRAPTALRIPISLVLLEIDAET